MYTAPHAVYNNFCNVFMCFAFLLACTPGAAFASSINSFELLGLTNAERLQHNLPPLHTDARLMVVAQEKANDMADAGYFAHVSPTGEDPWYWFARAGYSFRFAGENLAEGFADTDSIESAWMSSPEHRANILEANYTDIGLATSQGLYKGREVTFVVEEFGSPRFFINSPPP